MTTLEELKAAEDRMNKAEGALRAYTGRPQELQNDGDLHRRLAEELRVATEKYARLVFDYTAQSLNVKATGASSRRS
jgi:hypothetical protein